MVLARGQLRTFRTTNDSDITLTQCGVPERTSASSTLNNRASISELQFVLAHHPTMQNFAMFLSVRLPGAHSLPESRRWWPYMWPLLTPKVSEPTEAVSLNSPAFSPFESSNCAIVQQFSNYFMGCWRTLLKNTFVGCLHIPQHLSKRLSCKDGGKKFRATRNGLRGSWALSTAVSRSICESPCRIQQHSLRHSSLAITCTHVNRILYLDYTFLKRSPRDGTLNSRCTLRYSEYIVHHRAMFISVQRASHPRWQL